MDPENMVIPKGYAALYSNTDSGIEKYFYQLHNGDGNEIPISVVSYFGYKVSDLPVLIEDSKLVTALNKAYVPYSDFILSLSKKANTDYVTTSVNTKVGKNQFYDLLGKVAYSDEMQLNLDNKADKKLVNQELALKANSADVFTIKQTFEVLMNILGAGSCATIAERDALEYGSFPFVWVLDASDDLDPEVKSPAFYRWNKNHWDYLGTLGGMIPSGEGGGSDVDLTDVYNQINVLAQAINILQGVVNGLQSCSCSEKFGDGVTAQNTVTQQFAAVNNKVTQNTSSINSHIQNTSIHVTGEDKQKWNGYGSSINALTGRVTAIEAEIELANATTNAILEVIGGSE